MACRSIIGAAGALVLFAAAGCAPTSSTADLTQNRQDLFGEKVTDFDPEKAFLTLDQIPPAVQPPAPAPPAKQPQSQRVTEALQRAESLRAEKRYTEATIELERAQRYAPEDPAIQRALALTQWLAGSTSRAQTHVEEALRHNEDDLVAHYLLARIAASRFETTEAIRQYRIALLCTDNPATRSYRKLVQFHLAEALTAEGYLAAAIDLYKSFQAGLDQMDLEPIHNPELTTLVRVLGGSADEQIATALERMGRFDEAADYFRAAYAHRDMGADARRHYVKLLARAGHYDEAAVQARKLLATDLTAIDLLTVIYRQQHQPERIVDDLHALTETQPDNIEAAIAYAGALEKFDRDAEAVVFLKQEIRTHPDDQRLVWPLFDLFVSDRQWTDALDTAAAAIRAHDRWTEAATEHVTKLLDHPAAAQALAVTTPPEKTDESDFALAYLRGLIAEETQQPDLAEEWLAWSLRQKRDFIPGRVRLGRLYLAEYAWEKAIDVAAPAELVLAPDTRLETILGKAQAGLDHWDEAAAHLNIAIRLNRANTEAMAALADVYEQSGQRNRARREYEDIVDADALNQEAREQLFRLDLAEGDRRAAAEQIEEFKRISATPTRIARCVAQLELDRTAPDYKKFRKTLRDAMAAYRPDAETLYLIAQSYIDEEKPQKAIEVLHEALHLDPKNQDAQELLVAAYYRNLDFEQSLEQQRQLLERHPNRLRWRLYIVEIQMIVQDFDAALAEAKQLLKDPEVEERAGDWLRRNIVQTYLLRDEDEQALVVLRDWFDKSPHSPELLRLMINLNQQNEHYDRALELIRTWLKDFPMSYSDVGDTTIWQKIPEQDRDEVLQIILGQILDDPDNDVLQLRLLSFLQATGRYDEAIELAKSSAAIKSHGELYRYQLIGVYDAADRFDDAMRTINELMLEPAEPGSPAAYAGPELQDELVQIMVKAKEFDKAREKLNRWIKNARSNEQKVDYLRLLSIVLQESGDVVEARAELALAHQLAPSDVGINNDLGYTYADAGLNLDEAEQMIRVAVASDPRNGAYLDSLGWVHYKKGEFAPALKWLSMARHTSLGEDPVICEHLGDTCWRLGDVEAARKWWSEAVQFANERLEVLAREPDKKSLASAQARLDALDAHRDPEVAPIAE